MINPISSVSQGMSGAAPLNEAVLRFGASQESREQQRQERVSADERVEAPIDQATIDCSDDLPDDSATPQQGAQTQGAGENKASHHNHRAGDENAVNQRAPGQDDQQREAVLARHATEQQGKQEQHVDRSQRSTREMMGRIETSRAIDETAVPTDAARTASDDEGSSMVSSAKGGSDASGAGPVDDSSGGSDSAPVAAPGVSSGSAAPRIGGDVLAAAVNSGITTAEEIAPGSAQSDDKLDDNAQDVDSSQESRLDRQEEQGKKAARQRSLEGGTDFHDGDGGRDEKNHHRFQSGGQQQQHDRRPPRDDTPQGDSVAPLRRSSGEVDPSAVTVADPSSNAPSHAEVAALSAEAALEANSREVTADTHSSAASSGAAAETVPVTSASAPPHQPAPSAATATAASSQPPTTKSPETFERTAVLSPGLDLLGGGEEYFFFDDARLPEPPAAAS